MADASQSADQSMEEILQSIKRIIAEEGDDAAAPAVDDVLELTEPVEEPKQEEELVEEASEGDDSMAVDALLDSLAESEEEPSEELEADPAEVEAMFADTAVEEEPEEEAEPATEVEAAPEPEPEPEPEIEVAAEPEPESEEVDGSLIDDATALASATALKQLISPDTPRESDGLGFRNGITVEDLVVEAMRPMLKEWLDKNLPELVEELVEREIRKITAHLK